MDAYDAVGYGNDGPLGAHFRGGAQALYSAFNQLTDFGWIQVHFYNNS